MPPFRILMDYSTCSAGAARKPSSTVDGRLTPLISSLDTAGVGRTILRRTVSLLGRLQWKEGAKPQSSVDASAALDSASHSRRCENSKPGSHYSAQAFR